MKRAKIFTSIMLVAVLASLSAQTDIPKWRFGIGGGATSLRLKQGRFSNFNIGIMSNDVNASIQRIGDHYGWEGSAISSYYLNEHFRLQNGISISHVHSYAVKRVTERSTFLGIHSTDIEVSKVDQDYIFLELPFYVRWQIVSEENEYAGLLPFVDFGLKMQVPIVNKSTYERTMNDHKTSGKLEGDSPGSLFFGVGAIIGEKFSLAIDWSVIRQRELDYKSRITSIILYRYF